MNLCSPRGEGGLPGGVAMASPATGASHSVPTGRGFGHGGLPLAKMNFTN